MSKPVSVTDCSCLVVNVSISYAWTYICSLFSSDLESGKNNYRKWNENDLEAVVSDIDLRLRAFDKQQKAFPEALVKKKVSNWQSLLITSYSLLLALNLGIIYQYQYIE